MHTVDVHTGLFSCLICCIKTLFIGYCPLLFQRVCTVRIRNVLILIVCLRNDGKLSFRFVLFVICCCFFFFNECYVCPVRTLRPPFKYIKWFVVAFLRTFLHASIFVFPYCIKKKASLNGIMTNTYTVFLPVCVLQCPSPC